MNKHIFDLKKNCLGPVLANAPPPTLAQIEVKTPRGVRTNEYGNYVIPCYILHLNLSNMSMSRTGVPKHCRASIIPFQISSDSLTEI